MKLYKDLRKEKGATATEYLIMLGLIAIAIFAVIQKFGSTVNEQFGKAESTVAGTIP